VKFGQPDPLFVDLEQFAFPTFGDTFECGRLLFDTSLVVAAGLFFGGV
jgi:hypothetical protein